MAKDPVCGMDVDENNAKYSSVPGEMVPAVGEWGLTSEPWLFVVGADGRLADKLEGIITADEARSVLARALGA